MDDVATPLFDELAVSRGLWATQAVLVTALQRPAPSIAVPAESAVPATRGSAPSNSGTRPANHVAPAGVEEFSDSRDG